MDQWNVAKNVALRGAFEIRRQLSIPREAPLNVFDICTQLGIDVRFLDCTSLEGMYCREPRCRIFLPSFHHRPRGRITFSCAHELGHHRLGHGTHVDEYIENPERRGREDPDEYAADTFASHLLMPRQAVIAAFARRGIRPDDPTPLGVHTIAGELGVGYRSLLTHLTFSLGLLSKCSFDQLAKISPKSVRSSIWPNLTSRILSVDAHWGDVPADLQIGEVLTTPAGWQCDGGGLRQTAETNGTMIWTAVTAGRWELNRPGRSLTVRISRHAYVGTYTNCFRPEAAD